MTKKGYLFSGTAIMFALAAAPTAAAQVDPATPGTADGARAEKATDDSGFEEVIVTAQKRTENLQDVPIAASVFGERRRDVLGVEGQQDLAAFTPSLSWRSSPERAVIRGVGRVVNTFGSDPGVAQYIDGIYNSEGQGLFTPYVFLDRTEILRGPQGTLFGRNSIGGSINYISRRPTDQREGDLELTIKSFDTINVHASVSGHLTDTVSARFSYSRDHQGEGYLKNRTGLEAGGNGDVTYLEGQLQFDPSENFSVWLKVGMLQADTSLYGPVNVDPYDTTTAPPNPTFGYSVPNPTASDPFAIDYDTPSHYRVNNAPSVTLEANWDLGFATLKYLGGYAQFHVTLTDDQDGTSRLGYTTPGGTFVSSRQLLDLTQDKRWWSNEVTLTSPDDQPFRWIVGGYEYHEEGTFPLAILIPGQPELATPLDLTFSPGAPNPSRAFYAQDTAIDSTSYAVFGQIDYDFAPDWTFSLGGRYTIDEKNGFEASRIVVFLPDLFPGFSTALDVSTNAPRSLDDTWYGWSGHADVQWQPSKNTMAYAKISRGFKSGGFNLGAFDNGVDSETLLAYEAGIKTTLGGNFRINADVYYYDFNNQQVQRGVVSSGPGTCPGANCVVAQQFINAPGAESYGLEAEIIWAVTDNLELNFVYSGNSSKYTEDFFAVDALTNLSVNLKGRPLVQSPENRFAFNANYTFDMASGDLTLSGNYTWTDAQFDRIFAETTDRVPSYWDASLRAIYRDAEGRYEIIALVDNVFDQQNYTQIETATNGRRAVLVSTPRTFGLKLSYKFS